MKSGLVKYIFYAMALVGVGIFLVAPTPVRADSCNDLGCISLLPTSASINQGSKTSTYVFFISYQPYRSIAFSVLSDLPPGTTISWNGSNSNLLTVSCEATSEYSCGMFLDLQTSASTPGGNYPILIGVVGGSSAADATFTLTVNTPPPPPSPSPSPSPTTWSVSIKSSASTVTPGNSVTITATSNNDVNTTPYSIRIFEDSIQILVCGTGTTCAKSFTYNQTAAKTYTAKVSSSSETVATSDSITVNWAYPAPTLTFTANPTTVSSGGSSVLSWSATNATSCMASNSWSGSKDVSGPETVIPPSTGNNTYTLSCTGSGGTIIKDVIVFKQSTPVLQLSVSCAGTPNPTTTGTPVSWSSTVSGGNAPYTYSWTGSNNLSSTAATASKSYTTDGTKTATVAVSSDDGQRVSADCSITVNYPPVTASCSADKATANIGDPVTWSSLVGGGDGKYTYNWSGSDNLLGATPSVTKTYATAGTKGALVAVTSAGVTTPLAQCTAPGGGKYVTVTDPTPSPKPPACAILADGKDSTTINYGGSATLSWSSSNANKCALNGNSAGCSSSGRSTGALTSKTIYTLECSGSGGSSSSLATVNVQAQTPDPAAWIKCNDQSASCVINKGDKATLSWGSTNTSACTVSPGNFSGTSSSGQKVGPLSDTQTYTVTCNGAGSKSSVTAKQDVQVNVSVPPSSGFNFSLSVTKTSMSASQGDSQLINTVVATLLSGNSRPVSFSGSASPTGPTVGPFASVNNPCAPSNSCSDDFNVSVPSSAPAGSYTVTITGASSGGTVRTVSFPLTVNSPPPPEPPPPPPTDTVCLGSGSTYRCLTITPSWDAMRASGSVTLHAKVNFIYGFSYDRAIYFYIYEAGHDDFWNNPLPSGVTVSWPNGSQCVVPAGRLSCGIDIKLNASPTAPSGVYHITTGAIAMGFVENPYYTLIVIGQPPPPPPNDPPTVTPVSPQAPADYCAAPYGWTLNWNYSDPQGDSQAAYQVVIKDGGNVVKDTGQINSSSNSYAIPLGTLDFNKTYSWTVKVWDNNSNQLSSGAINGLNFSTIKHAAPAVLFSWAPTRPAKDEQVTFTDGTTVSGGSLKSSFLWTFPAEATLLSSTNGSQAVAKFGASGAKSIRLKVTDSDGLQCEKSTGDNGIPSFNIGRGIPQFREIAPR